MYKYSVAIKNCTGGWYDPNGFDKTLIEMETPFLPRKGEIIELEQTYLVTQVFYYHQHKSYNGICIYVIPVVF